MDSIMNLNGLTKKTIQHTEQMTEFRIRCSLLHEGVLLADFNRTVSAISTTVKDRGYVGLPLHYHYQ